jgi:hypothetical protein
VRRAALDPVLLKRIAATLVQILKTRTQARAVGILAMARIETNPCDGDCYGDAEPWVLDVLLPAEAYAQIPAEEIERARDVIHATLAEVTRTQSVTFPAVRIAPALVDDLGEAWQQEIGRWLPAALAAEKAMVEQDSEDAEGPLCPF